MGREGKSWGGVRIWGGKGGVRKGRDAKECERTEGG
jgi:hypothetical protein